MDNKTVIVLGINYYPELTGIGNYTGDMCNWLASNENKCIVITAYPHYPEWQIFKDYKNKAKFYSKEKDKTGYITIYRCPILLNGKTGAFSRIISELSFLFSSAIILFYLLLKKKPKLIWSVSPSQLSSINAIWYSKIKRIPFYLHIQDLQIEAALNLGIIKNKSLIRVLLSFEKLIYNNVKSISTISEKMLDSINSKTETKKEIFRNWVDTNYFFPINSLKKDEIRIKNNINSDSIIIMYSGSLGEKQGSELLLDLAKNYQNNIRIKFIVSSIGPYWERLKEEAKIKKLENIKFVRLKSKEKLNDFLNIADLHLILQKEEAVDIVLPSKLLPLMAIGSNIIIQTSYESEMFNLLNNINGIYLVLPNKLDLLISSIDNYIKNQDFKQNSELRELAIKKFEKNKILSEYFQNKIS